MRLFKLIPFMAILLIFGCSPDAADSPMPEDIFVKFVGESGILTAVDVVYNEDASINEFFILGTEQSTTNNTDLYFAVADAGGNQINFREIDLSSVDSEGNIDTIRNDILVKVKRLNPVDNDYATNYLVLGTSTNITGNENSKIIWKKVNHDLSDVDSDYFEITNSGHDLVAADIIPVAGENSVIIFGTTFYPEPGDNFSTTAQSGSQFFITKRSLDDNSEIWRKTLGTSEDEIALSIFELDNGNLALFGSTEKSEGNYTGTNVMAIFTNSLGTPDGTGLAFGFDSAPALDDVPSSVIKVGSEFKVTGTSSNNGNDPNAFMLCITGQGTKATNPIQSSIFSLNDFGLNTKATTITRAYNGDYLIMGSYPQFQLTEDGSSRLEEMMILRTDANGVQITGKDQFYGIEAGNDRANKAIALPDGTIAVVGTFDFGSGTSLIGLMKLNIDGELRN